MVLVPSMIRKTYGGVERNVSDHLSKTGMPLRMLVNQYYNFLHRLFFRNSQFRKRLVSVKGTGYMFSSVGFVPQGSRV